jgi:hypothetical protein
MLSFVKKNLAKAVLILFCLCALPFIAYEGFLWAAWGFSPYYAQGDRCLDNGGCWDHTEKTCRKDEANAQELCNRGKPRELEISSEPPIQRHKIIL